MSAITNDAASRAASDQQPVNQTSVISPDFNMFLTLLTTQIQNQDPLDPLDTSEYTQQLVQFSQVEQSLQQTSTLKDILSKLQTQDMTAAAGFIGKEARFDTPIAGFGGDAPATWSYTVSSKPASLVATVTDAGGKVVHTETIDPEDAGRYSWDGKLDNGDTAPSGTYTLALKATGADGKSVDTVINSVGVVKDVVSTDGQNVMLGVNGARFPLASLVAIASSAS